MNPINQAIIEELFVSSLSIESRYLQGLATSVFLSISTKTRFSGASYVAAHAINAATGVKSTTNHPSGSVGIVTINGPIVSASDPWYGIMGTMEAAQQLLAFDADPNIIGTVFYVESGGGAVYAIKPVCDVLNGLQKPVVLYSRTILASAALRIGANCDYMMMYHPQGIVGSIGTMYSSTELQPMFEKWGVKFNEYYATLSTLKNDTFNKAKQGDGKKLRETMLDPMNELFIGDMKKLRGHLIDQKDETIFAGETYFATQAIQLGLLDATGELSEAVAMVQSIANGDTPSALTPIKNNIDMLGFKRFQSLAALKGIESKSITEAQLEKVHEELQAEGITGVTVVPDNELEQLTNNQADPAAATNLTAANTAKTKAEGELSGEKVAHQTTKNSLVEANAKITKLEADLNAANAKIVELGGKPAAEVTTGKQETTDPIDQSGNKSKTYSQADAELAAKRQQMGYKKMASAGTKSINGVNAGFYPGLNQQ